MKILKVVLCLLLLCLIICLSVAMTKREEGESEGDSPESAEVTLTGGAPADETVTGSVTLEKTYSEGLKFRSNGDGTCALSGMGDCTASFVLVPPKSPTGDTVIEILPYAFKNAAVGAVELPDTVEVVSDASFAGCARLAFVRVSAGNVHFSETDGVLYSANGETLLYCPSGRNASSLALDKRLKRIAAGAFAECTTLQTVTYNGTTSEWHSVIVGDGNEPLYAARFRFSAA